MSTAEYFNVFESIFYGLILTQILAGWNKMIRDSGSYTFYWAHLLLTVALFLAVVQRYYGKFLHAGIDYNRINSSLDLLYDIVLTPSLLFVAVSQIFPKEISGTDLKEFCLKVRWKFTLPIVGYLLFQIFSNIQNGLGPIGFIPHLVIIGASFIGAGFRSVRWVEISIVLASMSVGYFLSTT